MDAAHHQNGQVESNQESIVEKASRLEKMEAMKRLLESLVELSNKNDRVLKSRNADQRENYLRMVNLLRTITELQERYMKEVKLNSEEGAELQEGFISG